MTILAIGVPAVLSLTLLYHGRGYWGLSGSKMLSANHQGVDRAIA